MKPIGYFLNGRLGGHPTEGSVIHRLVAQGPIKNQADMYGGEDLGPALPQLNVNSDFPCGALPSLRSGFGVGPGRWED